MSYRWVSDNSKLSQLSLLGYIPVIYFHFRFQIRGGLSNRGQTPSRVQGFWALSAFFSAHITLYIPINGCYSE